MLIVDLVGVVCAFCGRTYFSAEAYRDTNASRIVVCMYIYIYAVKLLSGPSLGVSKVIIWAKSMLLSGPSLFSHYKNRGFRRFFFCSVIILCFFLVSSYLLIF